MKRILTISLIIFFCASMTLGGEKRPYDFRKAKWGMTKEQVKKIEQVKPTYEKGNVLGYKDKVLGLSFLVGYIFDENGKLKSGSYILEKRLDELDYYVKAYKKLKKFLTKKYGTPYKEKVTWKNTRFKGKYAEGFAVFHGHLEYISAWETEGMHMGLTLKGGNFKSDLHLFYFPGKPLVEKVIVEEEDTQGKL